MEHYYSEKQDSQLRLTKLEIKMRGNDLVFYLASGVFSAKKVDKGSYLLAKTAVVTDGQRVLDLGCGNGIIGISIAKSAKCVVVMCDINERAITTTKRNIRLNKISNAIAFKSDGFSKIEGKFDLILLNPPQTAGKKLCEKLIEESKNFLTPDGKLNFVARHNKGGKSLNSFMENIFGSSITLERSGGFRVYQNA